MNVPAVEVITVEEIDRPISEAEERVATGLSRTTRWRLANEGRYPKKGLLGPWLSEVLLFASDPENYRVTDSPQKEGKVSVRKIRRRVVRSQRADSGDAVA